MKLLFEKLNKIHFVGETTINEDIEPETEFKNLLFSAISASVLLTYFIGITLTKNASLLLENVPILITCLGLNGAAFLLARKISIYFVFPLIYSLILILLLLPWKMGEYFGYLLIVFGLFGAVIQSLKIMEHLWLKVVMGLVAAVTMCASPLRSSLEGPVFVSWFNNLERAHSGALHQDHLFHSAIIAMFKSYGVVSTGLNGLVEIHYHVLFHKLAAFVSIISGASALEVYGTLPWIFFFPILVFGVVLPARLVSGRNNVSTTFSSWIWCCALIFFIPIMLSPWALWNSFIKSESTLVGFGLLAMTIPVLLKDRFGWLDVFLLAVTGLLMSLAKSSIGVLFVCSLGMRTLTYALRDPKSWTAFFLCGIFCFLILFGTAKSAAGSYVVFDPFGFSFIKYCSWLGESFEWIGRSRLKLAQVVLAIFTFILFHFLFNWFVLLRIIASSQPLMKSPAAVLNASAIVFPVIVLALYNMQSSMYYFTSFGIMVALPFIVAALPVLTSKKTVILLCLFAAFIFVDTSGINEKLSSFKSPVEPVSNFYKMLTDIRGMEIHKDQVYKPMESLKKANPVERISAKPFIYPALSERVWCDLIDLEHVSKGTYTDYGYPAYFYLGETDHIRIKNQTELLQNTKIIEVKYD